MFYFLPRQPHNQEIRGYTCVGTMKMLLRSRQIVPSSFTAARVYRKEGTVLICFNDLRVNLRCLKIEQSVRVFPPGLGLDLYSRGFAERGGGGYAGFAASSWSGSDINSVHYGWQFPICQFVGGLLVS